MTVSQQTPVTREESEYKRVPDNIETAAFTCLVNATWEDIDLRTLINTALTTAVKDVIDVTKACRISGAMEFINSEAVAHACKYGDADLPDNDDTVREFTMAAAAGSEFAMADIVLDAAGLFKVEVDDITKVTVKFHLNGYQYLQTLEE